MRKGAIEVGLEADLFAAEGNPLEDIWVVHDPMFVMSNGRLVYHRTVNPDNFIAPQVSGPVLDGVVRSPDEMRYP